MPTSGWFKDPYRLHDARWISDGRPTALVRDGGHESMDAPPDHPHVGTLTPVQEPQREQPLAPTQHGVLYKLADFVLSILPWPW
jgi:hypothetical protein